MPYRPDEPRYPHLELVREQVDLERRRRPGFGGPRPDRGGRSTFGQQLGRAAERIEDEQRQKPPPLRGVNPRLVFRIPFVSKPDYERLAGLFDRAGMSVVSVEADGAIVVFRHDRSLEAFRAQIEAYRAGPQPRRDGQAPATSQYDILEFIDPDGMHSWRREDRVGPRLAEVIGTTGERLDPAASYVVELELWHPGTRAAAQQLVLELRAAFQQAANDAERWLDQFVGSTLALAKVRATGVRLSQLLEQDIIASIDLPMAATFDMRLAGRATEQTFPAPPPPPLDGPRLCIVDSGIVSNHPLLRPYVGHEEAILTQDDSPADRHGHGTAVGGLAVYGDVRASYERGQFASTITLYSARVLNEHNRFDDERLIINQLREAVAIFAQEPYRCRIFNVSIGGEDAALSRSQRRQNLYGETLDLIAHTYNVLFVVAAGNHAQVLRADDISEALTTFPAQLLEPEARLCDFATTALGVTVGSLTEHDTLALRAGPGAEDIVRPIACRDEPAPMTRVGPGVQNAVKPDFVHYGGSAVFDRGRPHRLVPDPGTAVMTLSHEPLTGLFSYDIGTSFAAPRVARLAALIEHQLRQLTVTTHPNLIRALLAASARIPDGARAVLSRLEDPHALVKVCGYGLPNEDRALQSTDGRVVLFSQAAIVLDQVHIYRIPMPESLIAAPGLRSIRVALAFDPPVNGRRLDYLGVEMDWQLVRGATLDEVLEATRRLQPGEDAISRLQPSQVITCEPPATTRGPGGYSRKKSTLQCGTFTMRGAVRRDYGADYWLVVRAERGWAVDEQQEQTYAVAIALEANTAELYAQVRQRIQQRARVRL